MPKVKPGKETVKFLSRSAPVPGRSNIRPRLRSLSYKLETALQRARQEPQVLILRMRKVLAMDATGLNALEDLHDKLRKRGKHLLLSGPHTQPLLVMDKAGFLDRIGRENVCAHIDAALERSREILGLPPGPRSNPAQPETKSISGDQVVAALGSPNS